MAVAAYFLVVADRNRKAAHVTERSESVLSLQRLEDALARAESAQRGYLLTREERLLESYRLAVADIVAELDSVKARVAAGPRDDLPSDALATLVEAKLAELRRGVEVRDADGLADAQRELRSGDGAWLTETIEAVRAEMEAIERAELGEQRRAWFGRVALADAIFLAANVLLLGLVTAAGLGARAEMRRREEQAQERLRMLELQERILGIVSHDLRTPLSAIQGGAALLSRAELAPNQARVATLIHSSSRRMERIIRDLLDYTRTRARTGIPLAIRATDVGEVCARVADEAALCDRGAVVELHRDGESGIPTGSSRRSATSWRTRCGTRLRVRRSASMASARRTRCGSRSRTKACPSPTRRCARCSMRSRGPQASALHRRASGSGCSSCGPSSRRTAERWTSSPPRRDR
jgi:CHASE3 domain sensor protein